MILSSLQRTGKKYSVVLTDPPWLYSGDPNKDQAAGKHYDLMPIEEIAALPVRELLEKRAVVYIWATSPKLHLAMTAGSAWGLHYRGVAFVWIKTTLAGKIISGQGVRPSITKSTTEYVLAYTPDGGMPEQGDPEEDDNAAMVLAFSTVATGRPLPVLDEGLGQVVTAPRGKHSEKPAEVQRRIEKLHGKQTRLEMFARAQRRGWDAWGLGVGSKKET